MTHLYKTGDSKIVLLVRLKISYFSQLNRKSNLGNYLMPYKEEEKKICRLKFLFCCRCVETINKKHVRHSAIVLYVSHLPAYWETNAAVVSV